VAEELPKICRSYFKGMSDKREDNMVAGLSMGGYGAFKIGMTYPDRYFACGALSGAFDVLNLGKYNLAEWRGNWGSPVRMYPVSRPKHCTNCAVGLNRGMLLRKRLTKPDTYDTINP
jgi:enterochelin esterase-like enzyme